MIDGVVFCLIGVCMVYAAFKLRSFRRVERDSITGRLVNYPGARAGDVVMAIFGLLCVVAGIVQLVR
jgi:hypothetical protein